MTDRARSAATATVTALGGPTALITLAGWTLLTDPTFDPAGTTYSNGPVQLEKLQGPAIAPGDLPRVDVALVSHTQHVDNLDTAGRDVLTAVDVVLTTESGADDLGHDAVGLAPWQQHRREAAGKPALVITAVPAQHGPQGTEELTGPVTGFLLQVEDETFPTVYVSGDTVDLEPMGRLAAEHRVDVAMLHLGAAGFGPFGDVRLSFTAEKALEAQRALGNPPVVAIHAEGWEHYTEDRQQVEAAFAAAGASLVWPPHGATIPLPVAEAAPAAR